MYHQAVPSVMPTAEEIPALVAEPGSTLWRYAGDVRLIAAGAYAILLQVGHPTVGAGVSEHSDFRADPWGRLLRTLDYSYVMTYGGPELAGEMGRRMREMHKHIKGVKPDGERYSALEPEAYAWVHATLAHSIVRAQELLGTPIPEGELDRFYAEWRRGGRLIGVRERDLPETWSAFGEYFERMVDERLERTAAVDEVLESLAEPSRPELPFLPEGAWRIARIPAARHIALITGGLLSPRLRELYGVEWGRGQARQLQLLAAASRRATPLMPASLRNFGPSYLRWRRQAIARGDAASSTREPIAA
ncbi:MAG TPA: oxygenase MpaB family protein [Solirubrobacterales bacterium]